MYIYQNRRWPTFVWDGNAVLPTLSRVRHMQGVLLGRMTALGFDMKNEALLETISADVVMSSEIEGERLDTAVVRSSVARRLGLETVALAERDRHIDGVVDMMLDATQHSQEPLTKARLCGWHAGLFPTGYSGIAKITVADWRKGDAGPMRVISGTVGRERTHFQAPPSSDIPREMKAYLIWANASEATDPVLKAAVAHLWFVTIHPFDDGNGRIARAIADLFLTRADGVPQRFYSMSAQIRKERKAYYDMLEQTQKGGLDITAWLEWFLQCLEHALAESDRLLSRTLDKAAFWMRLRNTPINERQRVMLNTLWGDFEGVLTSSKWAKLTHVSQDTATRDLHDLIAKGILQKDSQGGRSTRYVMAVPDKRSPPP
jgi:Fic family protein